MTPDEIAALERRISNGLGINHTEYCAILTGGLACDCDGIIRWATDARANQRLLQMLAEACGSFHLILSTWPGSEGWVADIPNHPVATGPKHPDRKIAICLAADIWLKERVR